MTRTVYILSGPAGVGKSTTSRKFVEKLERSAYISGDDISHIPVKGRGLPWLCQETNKLTWTNILSLVRNLLDFNYDVVVDYIAFPADAHWLAEKLGKSVRVVYVVFMVDHKTIVARDQSRDPSLRMGERSIVLLNEFKEALLDDQHILNTQYYTIEQIDVVIEEIMNNKRFWIR
jgi:adenylate kinase family enzyme